jgi:ribosomal protein S18 acetylase RimI-like enzyme
VRASHASSSTSASLETAGRPSSRRSGDLKESSCSPGSVSLPSFLSPPHRAAGRWLGRVGVVRNEVGEVIGALSLQLPGDAAAYESLLYRSCSDAYDVLNPLDSSSVSIVSNSPLGDSSVGHFDESTEEDDGSTAIPPEFYSLGVLGALRFRYKHAITCDHVSPPGEAYVDFMCVGEASRRVGVGSRLLRWAEQSAEKLGCGRIALSVWGLDQDAQLFYERLGRYPPTSLISPHHLQATNSPISDQISSPA